MYKFQIMENESIPWHITESCYDHTVYKTKEWINFLIVTQGVKAFIIKIFDDDQLIGFFIGQRFSKLAVNIVASPFEGWTTPFQGLSMLKSISEIVRVEIYTNLIHFLFKNRICSFFQVCDRQLDINSLNINGIRYDIYKSYKLDLTSTEYQMFSKFKSDCRRSIRKSQKNGVEIREAKDIHLFTYHYINQLNEVFRKQGLNPTYKVDRVAALIDKMYNSNKIFLLEAITSGEINLATMIIVGDNKVASIWGGASYIKYQHFYPNERLLYEAIKLCKNRGFTELDLGGGGKYKEKYSPEYYEKPRLIASKYPGLLTSKYFIKNTYYGVRSLRTLLINAYRKNKLVFGRS